MKETRYPVNEEYFEPLKSKKEFYSTWEPSTIKNISKMKEDDGTPMINRIYRDYEVRWKIFKRDSYECQVEGCKFFNSPLTMHHYKHQSNNGDTKTRNCVSVCQAHQKRYHRGEEALTYKNNPKLPKHIRGHTQALEEFVNGSSDDEEEYDRITKEMLAESKRIRKANKHLAGIELNWAEIALLMYFLLKGYKYMPKQR